MTVDIRTCRMLRIALDISLDISLDIPDWVIRSSQCSSVENIRSHKQYKYQRDEKSCTGRCRCDQATVTGPTTDLGTCTVHLCTALYCAVLYCSVHQCQPNISIITPDSYTVLIFLLLIVLPSTTNLMAVSGTFQKSWIPSIQTIHHERFWGNSTQKVGQKMF